MTLALTQLKLSHFRSHKSTEITCDARPVAIFGPNGAGKTNILEAVSLFSPGRGIRRASAQDMPNYFQIITVGTSPNCYGVYCQMVLVSCNN